MPGVHQVVPFGHTITTTFITITNISNTRITRANTAQERSKGEMLDFLPEKFAPSWIYCCEVPSWTSKSQTIVYCKCRSTTEYRVHSSAISLIKKSDDNSQVFHGWQLEKSDGSDIVAANQSSWKALPGFALRSKVVMIRGCLLLSPLFLSLSMAARPPPSSSIRSTFGLWPFLNILGALKDSNTFSAIHPDTVCATWRKSFSEEVFLRKVLVCTWCMWTQCLVYT